MKHRIDYILQIIQLYSYKLPTCKIGNAIMDYRLKHTIKRKGEKMSLPITDNEVQKQIKKLGYKGVGTAKIKQHH